MNSTQQMLVGSGSLSPSAEVLVRRILEAALEFVAASSASYSNRDSNSLGGTKFSPFIFF